MNIDDPKLTAYALDELDEAERAALAQKVAASPEADREIQETQAMVRLLRKEFAAELKAESPRRTNLGDIRDDPWFWSIARPLAIAAVIAFFAVIGLAIFGSYKLHQNEIAQASHSTPASPPASGAVEAEVEDGRDLTNSYTLVRQLINDGAWPFKGAVRIEEMINYFTYDYPQPKANEPFSISVDIATCPWESSHRLVRIGLKGASAQNLRMQPTFNPARVGSYHLIGYKAVNNDEIEVAGMSPGQSVTVLYEIVPVGAKANPAARDQVKSGASATRPAKMDARWTSSSAKVLTVKLRYKKPDGNKSELMERAVVDDGKEFANASPDFKFAAAVAEFGMLLSSSEFKGNGTLDTVREWAEEGKGNDPNGHRAEFLELVRKAQTIKGT